MDAAGSRARRDLSAEFRAAIAATDPNGPADEAVAERMVREAGVAAIPVSAFYRDGPERGYLRLCFAKEDATLDAAIERLSQFRQRAA